MACALRMPFVQGFVGAFLFFYVFLLNVAIFKGQQQVVAMTFASCATVLAELAGPLLGSILFDSYGQRAVFWFLGVVSFMNQGMLVGVYYTIQSTTEIGSACPSPMIAERGLHEASDETSSESDRSWWMPVPGAWPKMKTLLQNPTFICANLIICMSGVIKGSVEEMLPFHADHQWGYDPVTIGKLFCTTAVSYFVASALVAYVWTSLGRMQMIFSSQCILLMGVSTCASFHVAYYYKDETALWSTLAGYGFCAGLTFTAAAQLIADVVDRAEGHAKDAANGIWNTMWELGGSTGFFMGGFLAHRYNDQMTLTSYYVVAAVVTAICMVVVSTTGKETRLGKAGKNDKALELPSALDYGSTA